MATSRVMGAGEPQWPSDEAANPRGVKVPTAVNRERRNTGTMQGVRNE